MDDRPRMIIWNGIWMCATYLDFEDVYASYSLRTTMDVFFFQFISSKSQNISLPTCYLNLFVYIVAKR